MKTMKFGVILLALLLAAMAMVPVKVSAGRIRTDQVTEMGRRIILSGYRSS